MALWVPTIGKCEEVAERVGVWGRTHCGTDVETVAWFFGYPMFINAHKLLDKFE